MSSEQFGGVVRALLSALGGYLVGKGIVDANTATQITGAVATLAVAAWSVVLKKPTA